MRRTLPLLLAPLALGSCIETGFTQITTLDVFQQELRQAVDLLIVVDNSCSMVEEQDNLARNFDTLISTFADADVSWRMGVTTTDIEVERYRGLLQGGDDEIIIRGPGGEIDRVEFTRDWEFERGVSLALTGDKLRFTFNDSRLNWCPGDTEYSAGHFGTPGELNPDCDGDDVEPVTPGPDNGPRAATADDLVITEIMPMSLAQDNVDSRCEWFELTSRSDDTLDLSGLVVRDRGNNDASFPAGVTLEPHGVLVVGRALDDNCGAPVDVALATGFSLNDDYLWIENDTPDGEEIFGEMVAQGTIGTGIEMGMEAARLVFEEPYWTDYNEGFLREDANFSILFVSDEDDLSPYPVDAYIRYFTELKGDLGYRDRQVVNMSAVVADEPPPRDDLPSCVTENGEAWYARRYLEIANETEGLVESICESDFAPIVTELGLTLSGLELEFGLSRLPNLDTLRVRLYAGDSEDSFIRQLERDVDFTYVVEGNLLRFEPEQVPPSEHIITAEYVALPTGVNDPLDEEAAR